MKKHYLFIFFIFVFVIIAFFPVHAKDNNNNQVFNQACVSRCLDLNELCLQQLKEEENKSKVKKTICKFIFKNQSGYCHSLCLEEALLFEDCNKNVDEFRIADDCLDDCDSHHAMCQLECVDKYKDEKKLQACSIACRETFSEDNSFCHNTCEDDINAFMLCED